MNKEELASRVKYLREVEHLTTRQIAEELGISRGKCLRLLSGRTGADRLPKQCVLDPYRGLVGEWYSVHPSLKASQVLERLKSRGVITSYTTVKRLTRPFRQKRAKCYFPMTFAPAEEAQVDWFVVNHPTLGRLAGFAFILSYSRFLFARIFPRLSFEFFIEGHLNAFEILRGLPRALRYDNLRSVVTKRNPITYNPSFLQFAHHYGFEIRLCNVRAGNEKGRVERAIRTIRETFLNTADQYLTLRALNTGLAMWTEQKNETAHRVTKAAPATLKKQESLKPLPLNAWVNRLVHPPKLPTKTGLLHYDNNEYSVPEHLVGTALTVHAFCERIEIYDPAGKRVASHPRSFLRGQVFINPLHRTFARVSVKTKTDRVLSVITRLSPVFDRFVTMSEAAGQDRFYAAYALFRLLARHPRGAVLSAVREAITCGVLAIPALHARLEGTEPPIQESVRPRRQDLLEISYQPRSLEEYSK